MTSLTYATKFLILQEIVAPPSHNASMQASSIALASAWTGVLVI